MHEDWCDKDRKWRKKNTGSRAYKIKQETAQGLIYTQGRAGHLNTWGLVQTIAKTGSEERKHTGSRAYKIKQETEHRGLGKTWDTETTTYTNKHTLTKCWGEISSAIVQFLLSYEPCSICLLLISVRNPYWYYRVCFDCRSMQMLFLICIILLLRRWGKTLLSVWAGVHELAQLRGILGNVNPRIFFFLFFWGVIWNSAHLMKS